MVRVLVFFCLFVPLFFISCEIINPSEQIPSYIAVDTVKVKINSPGEGTAIHNITDCWLYVNNKLIGVFEVPFKVPVLESGIHSIQIEPGIKNSGGDANRDIYPMMYGYYITDTLTEAEVLNIIPEFSYRPVVFDLIEDFEDIGIAFQVSAESDTSIALVSGIQAQEGKSMYVALDDDHPNFECRSTGLYEIEKNGSAFLEISFKCTDSVDFGLFALESNGATMAEIRKSVYTFKPTDTWKKVYIDLNYHVINTTGTQFRPYFLCARSEDDVDEKTEFYLDNIKLIYISTR